MINKWMLALLAFFPSNAYAVLINGSVINPTSQITVSSGTFLSAGGSQIELGAVAGSADPNTGIGSAINMHFGDGIAQTYNVQLINSGSAEFDINLSTPTGTHFAVISGAAGITPPRVTMTMNTPFVAPWNTPSTNMGVVEFVQNVLVGGGLGWNIDIGEGSGFIAGQNGMPVWTIHHELTGVPVPVTDISFSNHTAPTLERSGVVFYPPDYSAIFGLFQTSAAANDYSVHDALIIPGPFAGLGPTPSVPTENSHGFVMVGRANNGSEHTANWRQVVNVSGTDGTSTFLWRNDKTGTSLFATNYTTLMALADSGKLAVNKSTPTANLDVNGSGAFTGNLTVTGSGNSIGVGTSSPRALVDITSGTANTAGDPVDAAIITSPNQTIAAASNITGNLNIQSNNAQAGGIGGSECFGAVFQNGGQNSANFACIQGQKLNGTTGNLDGTLNFFSRNNASGMVKRATIDNNGVFNVIGTFSVNSSVAISSSPVSMLAGATLAGTLATGTTFQAMIADAAITLQRVCFTVNVAGIGGSGDTIKCNNAAGTGVSVTSGAAAVAGTTTCATTGAPANIAYQAQVSCHLDSGATTRPIGNMSMEYILQ